MYSDKDKQHVYIDHCSVGHLAAILYLKNVLLQVVLEMMLNTMIKTTILMCILRVVCGAYCFFYIANTKCTKINKCKFKSIKC